MGGNISSDRAYLAPEEESQSDSSYGRIESVSAALQSNITQNLMRNQEVIHPEVEVGPATRTPRMLYDANTGWLLDGLASESEPESETSYYPASTPSSAGVAINDLNPLSQSNGFEGLDRLEQGLEKLKSRHLILERIHMAHKKGVNAVGSNISFYPHAQSHLLNPI